MKKNFDLKFCLTLLMTLSLYVPLVAQTTYTSVQSGAWSSPSTWSPSGVPGTTVEGDEVIINTGHTVGLNISPAQTLAKVTVEGTLRFDPAGGAKTLKTRDVEVKTGGTINLISASFTSHLLQITPLSTDPPNQPTTFQNNGSVDFNEPLLTSCVLKFTRNTKGPQRLIGTGAFDLGPVVMENLNTTPPPTDFQPFAELDATQVIGEAGGSSISMQALLIENKVGQVRGTKTLYTWTPPPPPSPFTIPLSYRYREDNPTVVLVNLTIGTLIVRQGVMILNGNNGALLSHTIGSIEMGSTNSIALEYTDGNSEQGARHNTGIALVSAANAFTTLTVNGNVTAPSLTHTDEGVVLALVSPASGNGTNDASSSGAIMTVNGNFNFTGARLGLIGNGTNSYVISGDVRQNNVLPYRGGFANGTMRLEVKGNFQLKNTSRYNGRRGGGGSVPQIQFSGTSLQIFDADPDIWLGSSGETNAITNWEIASGATVQMNSSSGIAIHNQFGLTVNGTLVCQDGAQLIATLTGGGSGQTQLNMGPNGIIRVADVDGLGTGTLLDPAANAPLFIRRTSPGSSIPNEWNLTSINTNGTIDYNGSAPQVITPRNQQSSYVPNTQYYKLTISGGAKTLGSATAVVSNQLTLQGGAVSGTTDDDTVRILNSATTAISRTSGWINAPLERAVTGVSAQYFFPLGDAAVYRPITLQLTTGAGGTRLLAKLVSSNANSLAGVTPPLQKVSDLRYYEFKNLGVAAATTATMEQVRDMAINSDDAVNLANSNSTLKIATLSTSVPSLWLSRGPNAVNTSTLPTTFNSFTFSESVNAGTNFFVSLATESPADDPLPVELVEFVGRATGLGVELRWKTASERDNAGFVLLRNGQEIAHYRDVEALRGAGTLPVGRQYQFRDVAVQEGERYVYRLRSVDFDGTTHDYEQTVEVEATRLIRDYELMQNYPNPFNPSTTIRYALPAASEVSLRVYDMLGRMVSEVLRSVKQEAGVYEVRFDARGLSSGVYLYRLEATSAQRRFVETKKMLLMK